VAESLQTIVDSGGHVLGCRTSAVTQHHELDDLYDDVEAIISAWTSSKSTPARAGATRLFRRAISVRSAIWSGGRLILADAAETRVCVLLSISTLLGLGLFSLTGAAWLYRVAGLMIAACAVNEGREAWEGELVEGEDDED
jgi:hypothetical protein